MKLKRKYNFKNKGWNTISRDQINTFIKAGINNLVENKKSEYYYTATGCGFVLVVRGEKKGQYEVIIVNNGYKTKTYKV